MWYNKNPANICEDMNSRDPSSWIRVLIANLAEKEWELWEQLFFADKALRIYELSKWVTEDQKRAQDELSKLSVEDQKRAQNIIGDYNFKAWRNFYSAKNAENFTITDEDKSQIQKINGLSFNAVKKYIEVLARQVLYFWIQERLIAEWNKNPEFKLLLASDYDDIICWTDYILEIAKPVIINGVKKEVTYTSAIDLAITKNPSYVHEKITKKRENPKEYIATKQWAKSQMDSNTHFDTSIVFIPPDIMWKFIAANMYFLTNGTFPAKYQASWTRTPKAFDLFKQINEETQEEDRLNLDIANTVGNIREKFGIITNLSLTSRANANWK